LKCSAGTYSSVDASAQCTTCLANTATAVEGIQQCGQPAYSPLYCDAPVPSAAPSRLLSFSPPPRQPPSSNPIPGYGDYTFGQCGPCSTGYCNIGLSNVCSVCPNGSIAPNERSTSCTAYPADYFSVPVYGGTFYFSRVDTYRTAPMNAKHQARHLHHNQHWHPIRLEHRVISQDMV
jgi:hypothetical protein